MGDMTKIQLKYMVYLFAALILAGCATSYSSLNKNKEGTLEVIASTQEEVLSAIFEGISREFPSASINQLSGYQSGFSWFHMPMLDRTNFKLTVAPTNGENINGLKIEGYSYSIVTEGTQGLVEARYVKPLTAQIDTVLSERGIQKVEIKKVVFSKSRSSTPDSRKRMVVSTGTGFFISKNGYLITNHHVVKGASKISLVLHDGSIVDATLVNSDPINDIALLKVNVKTPALELGGSATVNKGEQVLTLGYPLIGLQGQEQKATFGRVNSLSGVKGDIRFLQIDVPIQPGNSGGPLIDGNGKVIGIITAALSQINTLRATGVLPQSVNYAVKSDYIFPILAGKVEASYSNKDGINETDMSKLVDHAEKSVALVIAQ